MVPQSTQSLSRVCKELRFLGVPVLDVLLTVAGDASRLTEERTMKSSRTARMLF